jgi:hypothetical protein
MSRLGPGEKLPDLVTAPVRRFNQSAVKSSNAFGRFMPRVGHVECLERHEIS